MDNLVIVESPAKAKTIGRYLGAGYRVLASYGHIRDLEAKDGSVRPDEDFAMVWRMDGKGASHFRQISAALAAADKLILATDPDREGEAIAWHLTEALKEKKKIADKPVERISFNAVTRDAVREAMKHPRDLDKELVDAYLARRALDYLVGFTLSPLLWRKLPGARSAGRVQSVALRLICEREAEREVFIPREYWDIEANLHPQGRAADSFTATLALLDGEKLDRYALGDETAAQGAKTKVEQATWAVEEVEAKPVKRNPAPPFTTSSLQQEGSNRLGWPAQKIMRVAQRLYEGAALEGDGLITYMRTDGVQIVPQAIEQMRGTINESYGAEYVPEKPVFYKSKARNAQEAHEAIRPVSFSRPPETLAGKLTADDLALYRLIWNRALASQMAPARMERTTIELKDKEGAGHGLRAVGTRLVFDGFLKLYGGGDKEKEQALPKVEAGTACELVQAEANQHFTQPPPRYTEASLVKKLEELGIGRPSTYAPILSVLGERGYTRMEKRQLAPESRGRVVTAFLEKFFTRYVDYDFTAGLEEDLDRISSGKVAWRKILADFWRDFTAKTEDIKELRVGEVIDHLNTVLAPYIFPKPAEGAKGDDMRQCPDCGKGKLSLRLGRYGAFVGCDAYPECRYIRNLGVAGEEAQEGGQPIERELGQDADGLAITLKSGPYGPYVEKEALDSKSKPRRASLPKQTALENLTLEEAQQLLALPRDVGEHPTDGKPIRAGMGRFGPYIVHDGLFVSLRGEDDVYTIGLNRAITLIADKEAKGGRKKAEARKKAAAKKAAAKRKSTAKKKTKTKRKTATKKKPA